MARLNPGALAGVMTAAAILGCAPALIAYAVFNGTVAVIVWAVIFVAATLYWASKQERR